MAAQIINDPVDVIARVPSSKPLIFAKGVLERLEISVGVV
jgi:hypothetical protein